MDVSLADNFVPPDDPDRLVDGLTDLTDLPLIERKARLAKLLEKPPPSVLYVNRLEGLVAKRKDSVYQPGVRTRDWVKVKRKGAIPTERFKRGPKTNYISIGL